MPIFMMPNHKGGIELLHNTIEHRPSLLSLEAAVHFYPLPLLPIENLARSDRALVLLEASPNIFSIPKVIRFKLNY